MAEIRTTQPSDAPAIASVKKAVWPDETVNIQRIAGVIEDTEHTTHVAVDAGHVVGFVDGFVTRSETGTLRWEVDLLAVDPDFQRRGIAKRLIQASGQAGHQASAELERSLIHVGNVGSMKAFAGCGYHAQGGNCGLFVDSTDTAARQQSQDTDPYLVWVRTINYHGLWIEGNLSAAGFEAAKTLRLRHNLDLVGAVIPLWNDAAIQAACLARYRHVGEYQYWTRAINKP